MESFDSSTKIPKMILYFSSRALSPYESSLQNAYQESLVLCKKMYDNELNHISFMSIIKMFP